MIIHWEVFTGGPTPPRSERLHVTLNKKNVILINGNIHDKLGNPEAVMLMFDKVNSIIGLNPVGADTENSFPVKPKSGGGRHRLIRATPFCKFNKIKVDVNTAFLKPEIDEEGILRLDL